MVSVFLVAVAAAIVYSEILLAYRTLMRSRAKLEAQTLAFDTLWATYNLPSYSDLPSVSEIQSQATPQQSIFGDTGVIEMAIIPEIDMPLTPELIQYWDLLVQVWPAEGSPLQIGEEPLARYAVRRYRGER
jgi:hypothetical protein